MAKMIEGDLRIPKMYNFIFTIIFDFRPKVDGVILLSPLKLFKAIQDTMNELWAAQTQYTNKP